MVLLNLRSQGQLFLVSRNFVLICWNLIALGIERPEPSAVMQVLFDLEDQATGD
jgi:hypothetical protein